MKSFAERDATRNSNIATFVSIYDGRRCLGHILPRGKSGFEAFDRDDKPVGIFKTQLEAARALMVLP